METISLMEGFRRTSPAASLGQIRRQRLSHEGRDLAGERATACEMVLDIIGDLFTHGRQLKHLVFNDRIVSLLGKLPIVGRLVPEIVSPIHVAKSNEPGRDSERMAKGGSGPLKARQYQTGLVQGGEIKLRRAAYGDAPPCIRHLRHPVTGADLHGAADLVLAPHCPACDTVPASVRRMGLSVIFRFLPAF
jgi:hypothetical protein